MTARIADAFPDREFYMRSHGRVRFLTVTRRLQLTVAGTLSLALIGWLAVSGVMLVSQYQTLQTELAVNARAAKVARTAQAVETYRGSVEDRAERLETRQDFLETLAEQYFGGTPTAKTQNAPIEESTLKAVPGMGRLSALERRQLAYAEGVTKLAIERAAQTEAEVARLGLSSARLLGDAHGQGGPFVSFSAHKGDNLTDTRFVALTEAMDRLNRLESALISVPSFMPARNASLTSPFGFRYDPITRAPARHMGQDFRGAYGEPILAAAPGRVVKATRMRGYGNIVVVDHGRGIRTRYAHLSRINVKPGQRLARGEQLGRMGSTGRSTGTHLHFEVRVDGNAVNPRPFLEATPHVLEIQSHAAERLRGSSHAG